MPEIVTCGTCGHETVNGQKAEHNCLNELADRLSHRIKELEAYGRKVLEMRNAQTAYFKDRNPDNLARSKQLEMAVDETTARLLGIGPQGGLF